MQTIPNDEPALTTAHLPQPRGSAHWRWSAPRRAAVAGGAMAAVLGLGTGVAGATTSSNSSTSRSGAPSSSEPRGHGPSGSRPTLGGKITALSADDITVKTSDGSTLTVVYSSKTTFISMSGKGTSNSASASSLKVGEFIGVWGTKSGTTVSATAIMIGTMSPNGGKGGPPGKGSNTSGTPPRAGAPSA
jgi:hypothetical protein